MSNEETTGENQNDKNTASETTPQAASDEASASAPKVGDVIPRNGALEYDQGNGAGALPKVADVTGVGDNSIPDAGITVSTTSPAVEIEGQYDTAMPTDPAPLEGPRDMDNQDRWHVSNIEKQFAFLREIIKEAYSSGKHPAGFKNSADEYLKRAERYAVTGITG